MAGIARVVTLMCAPGKAFICLTTSNLLALETHPREKIKFSELYVDLKLYKDRFYSNTGLF